MAGTGEEMRKYVANFVVSEWHVLGGEWEDSLAVCGELANTNSGRWSRLVVFEPVPVCKKCTAAWRSLLAEFCQLGPNWDSYGAEPITPVAARLAEEILSALPEPYVFAPIADGGLFAEWRAGDRTIELEMHGDGDLGYLLVWGGDRRSEEDWLLSAAEAVKLIQRWL